MSVGASLAVALQRNRELTIELYTMRNESPPDDSGCGHCLSTEGVLLASQRATSQPRNPREASASQPRSNPPRTGGRACASAAVAYV